LLEDRIATLWEEIERAGGSRERVQLCAVTKTQPREVVDLAASVGLSTMGENYATELLEKARHDDAISWHFLGALQRKKIPKLATVVDVFQGLSRIEEAEALAKVVSCANVLVQIDTTGLSQRNGISPEEFPSFYEQLTDIDVTVLGVMTVAPQERGAARSCFTAVRQLAEEFRLPVCSMGMSGDLHDAVEAGSTMVRVGTALFGSRS
jgi:pyridoxal phosphate enzyme (YggS family)